VAEVQRWFSSGYGAPAEALLIDHLCECTVRSWLRPGQKRCNMLDELDKVILAAAYDSIEASEGQRVAGSAVWETVHARWPDIAPVTVPARLRRLVNHKLLQKDERNSSCRTKLYGPTEAGRQLWLAGR
jgi:hypothetical protein